MQILWFDLVNTPTEDIFSISLYAYICMYLDTSVCVFATLISEVILLNQFGYTVVEFSLLFWILFCCLIR